MSIESIEKQLKASSKIPPVHQWKPALSGDIDIRIARDGRWYHEGDVIKREKLVQLFASILWREKGEYFLLTPVEKWRIQVDEEPLLVIAAARQGEGSKAAITLSTSTGDNVLLDQQHRLFVDVNDQGEPRPVVRIRYELDALIHRNVYYQLVDWAEQSIDGAYGVWSAGEFFPLS
ncbi:DUF1285 domain-containing protein [Simiduia curdlanivorans]|uniref:DUF1285 domain-containing protein n=1 Tax=Simiduia curdlanivorans TaxID=1492769 RepID=A0ABV8V7X2_9GAMM|nr:DUF1285 domain-containing protein [Simiduia curdlanivorans]MDN3639677.1 DUF1285 domain-containing protein [Simiduia curdlanivorans]